MAIWAWRFIFWKFQNCEINVLRVVLGAFKWPISSRLSWGSLCFLRSWSILSKLSNVCWVPIVFSYYPFDIYRIWDILSLVMCIFFIFPLFILPEVCQFYWSFQETYSLFHWFLFIVFLFSNTLILSLMLIISFYFHALGLFCSPFSKFLG